jgi:uncharacterized BrkB/YihY/UPF0761 family membrane protein
MDSINWSTLVSYLLDAIKAAKDFAVKEIPDVIYQLLQYEMINVLSKAIVLTIFVIVLGFVLKNMINRANNCYKEDNKEESGMFSAISVLIGLFMAVCLYFTFSFYVVSAQIYFTPKAYLIHYAKDLMQNDKQCEVKK